MTSRGSAFGSYASARAHRLCPGRTATLARYRPDGGDPARVACAAVASPTDSAPMRSADRPVNAMRPRRVSRSGAAGVRRGRPIGAAGLRFTVTADPLSAIVTMSTSFIKRLFDDTRVRSTYSSIERQLPSLYRAAPVIKRHVEQMFGDIGICDDRKSTRLNSSH